MKVIAREIMTYFDSSPGLTPEFDAFRKKFRTRMRRFLNRVGATDIKIKFGHFYINGNFTYEGQAYYFNSGDVRGIMPGSIHDSMLIRTVQNYDDRTGGYNQYAKYDQGIEEYIKGIIGIRE